MDSSLRVLLLIYSVWLTLLLLFALPFMAPFSLSLPFMHSVIISFSIPNFALALYSGPCLAPVSALVHHPVNGRCLVTSPPIFRFTLKRHRAAGSSHSPNIHHRPPTSVHTFKHLRAARKISARVVDPTRRVVCQIESNRWSGSRPKSRITPRNYTLIPIITPSYADYLGTVIRSCKTCNA